MRIWFDQRLAPLSLDTSIPAAPLHFHYWIAVYASFLASKKNPVETRVDYEAQYLKEEAIFINTIAGVGSQPETEGLFYAYA
jgi:hypothetical protein